MGTITYSRKATTNQPKIAITTKKSNHKSVQNCYYYQEKKYSENYI